MYAVTGITGKVGGAVASALLEASLSVRAVVRDDEKGKPWAAKGCAVALFRDPWRLPDDAAGL
jgi:NAD(P)H dehydrogenase (quinone)